MPRHAKSKEEGSPIENLRLLLHARFTSYSSDRCLINTETEIRFEMKT